MLSRRLFLATGLLYGKASQPATKLRIPIPKNACDCHTHIFAPQFPFAASRSYTPESAMPAEMRSLYKALHVDRVVIVNPSVYGTDNAATAYGIRAMGLKRARGIAVIAPEANGRELHELDRVGFRGIRLNFATGASPDVPAMRARLKRAVEQVRPLNWHIQIYTNLTAIAALEEDLLAVGPTPIVLDHVCAAIPSAGVGQPGFDVLLRLVRTGNVYVKITHRFISTGPEATGELAKALIAAKPERMLWGTDWPHPDSSSGRKPTEVSPLEAVDDGAMLNRFASWMPADVFRRILVENPAVLYKF